MCQGSPISQEIDARVIHCTEKGIGHCLHETTGVGTYKCCRCGAPITLGQDFLPEDSYIRGKYHLCQNNP